MAPKTYMHADITHQIIGCAMKIHTVLGNGFQEVIYQRALAIELERAALPFQREVEMNVYYDGIVIGARRADFVVKELILVELKALITMEEVHLAQIINYLEAYRLELGLLLNFGAKRLEYRRFINSKYSSHNKYSAIV